LKKFNSKIQISELLEHTIAMKHFQLKERFTDEDFNVLPPEDLSKIHPLSSIGESYLYKSISPFRIRTGYRLNDQYFSSVIELNMKAVSDKEIKEWLDDLGIKSQHDIILMWDNWGSVVSKWQVFRDHYQDFFYPVSDDLTIIDESMNWTLYLQHDELMYYGRNDDIILKEAEKLNRLS